MGTDRPNDGPNDGQTDRWYRAFALAIIYYVERAAANNSRLMTSASLRLGRCSNAVRTTEPSRPSPAGRVIAYMPRIGRFKHA